MLRIVTTALAVLGALVGLTLVLDQSRVHLSGTNSIAPRVLVLQLPPGHEACQATSLPTDTARVDTVVGVNGHFGPPLTLTVRDGARTVLTAPVAGGYLNGDLAITLPLVHRGLTSVLVCLRDRGPTPIALAGVTNNYPVAAAIDGRRVGGAFTVLFYMPRSRNWFQLVGTIARRWALIGPSWIGSWTLWALAVLVLAIWVTAIRLVVRETSRRR